MAKIFGVDIEKAFSPLEVRDAIVKCFADAEACDLTGNVDAKASEAEMKISEEKIRRIFDELGEDYDKPTKESLIRLIERLRKHAIIFRDKEMVARHFSAITELIEKL